jgi:hypothetical protein
VATATTPRIIAIVRVLLTLTVAIMLGATLVPTVDAKKNTGRKPTSIAARVKKEKQRREKNIDTGDGSADPILE